MASYLLVIGNREAVGWILTTQRMAFPSGTRTEVGALSEGDELFLYTTRGAYKNPTRDLGRIIGTAIAKGSVSVLSEPVHFGDREYPVGCALDIEALAPWGEGVILRDIVSDLEAFKGAGTAWSIWLRRPLLRLTKSDANAVHGVLDPLTSTTPDLAPYTRWFAAASASGHVR